MRRRRPEEERADQPKKAGTSTHATGILALQQSAGNHAVTNMLSREAEPEREPATVNISDLGTIIVENWNTPAPRGALGGATQGAPRRKDDEEGENLLTIVVSAKVGAHSAKLQQYMGSGKVIPVAAFENRGIKYRLEDAFIVSYSASEHEGVAKEMWEVEGKLK